MHCVLFEFSLYIEKGEERRKNSNQYSIADNIFYTYHVDHCRTGFSKYVLRLLLADHAVREDKLNSDWRINGKLNRFTTKL